MLNIQMMSLFLFTGLIIYVQKMHRITLSRITQPFYDENRGKFSLFEYCYCICLIINNMLTECYKNTDFTWRVEDKDLSLDYRKRSNK